jgi:hypothetical protein
MSNELDFDVEVTTIPVTIDKGKTSERRWQINELLGSQAEIVDAKNVNRFKRDKNGNITDFKIDVPGSLQLDLLETCVTDRDTGRAITRAELQKVPSKIIASIYDAAQKLNQLGKYKPKEGDEKNESSPESSDGSESPNTSEQQSES